MVLKAAEENTGGIFWRLALEEVRKIIRRDQDAAG